MLSPSSARGPVVTVVTLSLNASYRTSLACTPYRILLLYSAICILRRQSCHTHVYVINWREESHLGKGLALHQRVHLCRTPGASTPPNASSPWFAWQIARARRD